MKYMTFNSSCSFAGIANMLEHYGIDVSDRDIALGMKLPFLFAKEEGEYKGGPMLQSAPWFNIYLKTIGFEMMESMVPRENISTVLSEYECAMLGIHVSENNKHAVIYTGRENSNYCFINNKWAHTDEPERITLGEKELLTRIDETAVIAVLNRCPRENADFTKLLENSCNVLKEWKDDVNAFCSAERRCGEIMQAMNPLFRAILLDGITMLELLGRKECAETLRGVQSKLIETVKAGKSAVLCEELPMKTVFEAVDSYIDLIKSEL